jgi:ADP-heptose:LPS heptosyltransferase
MSKRLDQDSEYSPDCLHFRGDVPCRPHKARGVHCRDCPEFVRREGRILLIKLGAAGDVLRTTPLLRPVLRDHPHHLLSWITRSPELLPSVVHHPLPFSTASVLWARHTEFSLLINLDKDREACALASEVTAEHKHGFLLGRDGICRPASQQAARQKYLTGLFDDVNQACRLSYPQEIFQICGYEFAGEEYILDRPEPAPQFELPAGKARIGLNTGCGGRWPSRLWPEAHWRELAGSLQADGLAVVLLGGPQEDARNRRLAAATGACYPGHFDLRTFIGLIDQMDLVVTAVTMAMHIAIGLRKPLALINNIFNPNEFELYGRGRILSPEQPCHCFFQPRCTAESFCLETLSAATVRSAVRDLLDLA